MDYSGLNSLLSNLEVDTTTPNNDFNYQIYNETQRFANPVSSQNILESNTNFNSNTGLNKLKQKTSIENLAVNRNNEMLEINGMNRHFNFERINPQRDINSSNQNIQKSQDSSLFSLNRNLQVNNLTNQRNINIFDNSKFSEDFKNYKDVQQNGNYDNNSINLKLSNRDNIPNLSTIPNQAWK